MRGLHQGLNPWEEKNSDMLPIRTIAIAKAQMDFGLDCSATTSSHRCKNLVEEYIGKPEASG